MVVTCVLLSYYNRGDEDRKFLINDKKNIFFSCKKWTIVFRLKIYNVKLEL